jgi:DNA-binding IclR family transcriptional regulator
VTAPVDLVVTAAQGRVLAALIVVTSDGWPGSVSEVAARAGIASKSTAWAHLRELEEAGLVVRHPRSAKGGFLPA